jgi:hypothetical protein
MYAILSLPLPLLYLTILLLSPVDYLLHAFQRGQPHVNIGQSSFMFLKLFYVKTLKDRSICCCKHHVGFILLKDALNQMRPSKNLHSPNCSCSCVVCSLDFDANEMEEMPCTTRHLTYKGITTLWHEYANLGRIEMDLQGKLWGGWICVEQQCKTSSIFLCHQSWTCGTALR